MNSYQNILKRFSVKSYNFVKTTPIHCFANSCQDALKLIFSQKSKVISKCFITDFQSKVISKCFKIDFQSKVCNFAIDCNVAEDEAGCPTYYTFDGCADNLQNCHWKEDFPDHVDWVAISGLKSFILTFEMYYFKR